MEKDGLIHISKTQGRELHPNQPVKVQIESIQGDRVSLRLVKTLWTVKTITASIDLQKLTNLNKGKCLRGKIVDYFTDAGKSNTQNQSKASKVTVASSSWKRTI